MINALNKRIISKYLKLLVLILFLLLLYRSFDINLLDDLIGNVQVDSQQINIVIVIAIFLMRFISIVIPMIPGTYCSVLSGYLFGLERGLILIFVADLLSCTLSFTIARQLGRGFVIKFLGQKQMYKVEKISHKYLENNFFLMTAFLMTQFFDFVCYAIGLTKVSLRRFFPALIISILISDAPFVAGGYAFRDIKEISLSKIINGDVSLIYGNYLLVFIVSILLIISLGILNILINKRTNFND